MLVVVPAAPFPDVGGGELPVLLRPVDPLEEAGALLLLGQVQEDLHHFEPVVREVVLPAVDLPVAAVPHVRPAGVLGQVLPDEVVGVHPHDEDLLVVRAVEDGDLAARRKPPGVPPQVVVVQLLGRGHLEAADPYALGIDAAHHVADRPVLAPGVDGLEAHQHAVRVLGGQPVLVLGQQRHPDAQQLGAVPLLQAGLEAGIEVPVEAYARPGLHPQRLDELRDAFGSLVRHHPSVLRWTRGAAAGGVERPPGTFTAPGASCSLCARPAKIARPAVRSSVRFAVRLLVVRPQCGADAGEDHGDHAEGDDGLGPQEGEPVQHAADRG